MQRRGMLVCWYCYRPKHERYACRGPLATQEVLQESAGSRYELSSCREPVPPTGLGSTVHGDAQENQTTRAAAQLG